MPHHFSGRLFKKWGLYLLVFTLLMELILIGAKDIPFAIGGDLLYIPQLIVLFIPIFLTEHALRKNFDAKGQPITKTTRYSVWFLCTDFKINVPSVSSITFNASKS